VLTIYEIDHPEVLSLKVSAVRRLIYFAYPARCYLWR